MEKKKVKRKATNVKKETTKKKASKPSVKEVVKRKKIKTLDIADKKIKKKKAEKKPVKTKKAEEEQIKAKKVRKKVSPSTKAEKNIKKPVKKANTKKAVKKITKKINKPIEPVFETINYNDLNIEKPVLEKKTTKKESILIGIIVVLAVLLFVCVFLLFRSNVSLLDFDSTVEKEAIRALPKEADPIYKETWQEYHNKAFVPDDYVGQIIFESEIINEPVLQGDTNETYVRRNYETYKYEVCGPVFMDYICDVNTDQNLILYGHNRSTPVDPEHVMMFSPLHVLEKEENYDENKLIYMAYEDRLDIYLVASVYRVKVVEKEDGNQYLVKGEPLYYLNNYSPDQFDTYYKTIKQKQMYDTGVELVNTDKLLTLQTCYEDSLDKMIVLAKKIGSIGYKGN